MILYEPVKVLFKIGAFAVHSWGLLFVIAFLFAFFFVLKEAKKQKINEKHIYNLALLIIIGAIVGSRLFYCLEHLSFSIVSFALNHGGMTSYGGIFLALILSLIYIKKQKLNLGIILDLFAPYVVLGLAIARIGCFLNWCCYGQASSLPWAIAAAGDVARHPTQLYLLISNLFVFGLLLKFKRIKESTSRTIFNKSGSLFLFFILLYSTFRFCIDFLRDYEIYWLHLALSQWILLALIVISLILLFKKKS